MKIKVTFSGGFHNSPAINMVFVSGQMSYLDYLKGNITKTEFVQQNASEYQLKRLERHFCGIKGCTCGSWLRADMEIQSK